MATPPSRFGPYELQRRLGAGGMAETFLAVRRGPGGFEQHVCLKRILPAFEADEEFVRLFLEEARIAARLRHTNIVQVLDFGVVEGQHFLALELVDGLDLRGLLDQMRREGEAMTTGLAVHLAFELGNALDFAHQAGPDGRVRGVVHRDISPSNILVSTAGEVKLTDFGIAKAMNKTQVTRSGTIKGKVPYMAPEYALRMEFDARSDLFSLGVTLYEALAGKRPFDGLTELDTLRRIQEGEHEPLGEVLPSAPKALVDAVEGCLAPDAADRPANAADLLDALVDVAPPPTARRILGELVRRMHDAKRASEPKPPALDAFAATVDASPGHANPANVSPGGTAVLPDQGGAPPSGDVRPAAPHDPTRTRLPGDPAGAAATAGHTATELDPHAESVAAASHSGASWSLGAATPAPSGSPSPWGAAGGPAGTDADEEPPSLPGRAIAGWVWALVAVLVFGAIGGTAWMLTGDGEPHTERSDETEASRMEGAEAADDPAPEAPPTGKPSEATSAAAADDATGMTPTAVTTALKPRDEPRRASPTRPAPSNRGGEEAAQQAEAAVTSEADSTAGAERERPTRARRPTGPPAHLEVVVIPFGDVWIDGRMAGSSPVTESLPPGRHVIATGDGAPTKRRVIELEPGQRERLIVRH